MSREIKEFAKVWIEILPKNRLKMSKKVTRVPPSPLASLVADIPVQQRNREKMKEVRSLTNGSHLIKCKQLFTKYKLAIEL